MKTRLKSGFRDRLEQIFKVYEEYRELVAYTDRGYNIILSVQRWTPSEVKKAIEDFNPNDEVYMWWADESFKENYNHEMSEALDDLKSWKLKALGVLDFA